MWVCYKDGLEYMEHIRKVRREIRLLMEQIERDTVMASGVSAIRYDIDHVQSSPIQDRMGEIVTTIVMTTETLHDRIHELQELESDARSILIQLKEEHERILTLHYFDGKNWTEVASNLGYNDKYLYELRDRALTELTEVLEAIRMEVSA